MARAKKSVRKKTARAKPRSSAKKMASKAKTKAKTKSSRAKTASAKPRSKGSDRARLSPSRQKSKGRPVNNEGSNGGTRVYERDLSERNLDRPETRSAQNGYHAEERGSGFEGRDRDNGHSARGWREEEENRYRQSKGRADRAMGRSPGGGEQGSGGRRYASR